MEKATNSKKSIFYGVLAAIMLILSAYARPSIYLLWIPLSLWIILKNRRKLISTFLFALISYSGILLWEYHNLQYFNNYTFSTIGAYTMTYYRTLSVLRLGENLSPEEAQVRINQRVEAILGHDTSEIPPDIHQGYLAATPDIEQALLQVNLEIIQSYPVIYIATFILGFLRFFPLIPPVPPLSNLLRPSLYITPLWNWFILICMLLSIKTIYKNNKFAFWGLILIIGYFTAGTLLVKSAGMTGRERTVIFPFIAIAAGYYINGFLVQKQWLQKLKSE